MTAIGPIPGIASVLGSTGVAGVSGIGARASPVGANKLSAAVFVDKTAIGDIKPDDLKAAIAAAINTDVSSATPRDNIVVQAVAFAPLTPLASAGPDLFSTLGGVVPTVGGALLAGALLFLVWRNMKALRGRAEEIQLNARGERGRAPMSWESCLVDASPLRSESSRRRRLRDGVTACAVRRTSRARSRVCGC
jgi:hypothetical protein